MNNIENILLELSKDCENMLKLREKRKLRYKGIILIGEKGRCEEFLNFFNNFTNYRYQRKIIINPNGQLEGEDFYKVGTMETEASKTFYIINLNEIYGNLRT